MEIGKGIRGKIFIFLIVMGIVPFMILVVVGSIDAKTEMEDWDKQSGLLRNAVISEHMTELIDRNQAVLHTLALNPAIVQYVQEPKEEQLAAVTKLIDDTNALFNDTNMMGLTAGDGWQLIRTDKSTLVNLKKRQHFQEAMKGRAYVSDIISSMSTGKMVIVMEVPVLGADKKPVGMLQRNFDLIALQEFVKVLDDSESSIIIMDRRGRIIANSDKVPGAGNEYMADSSYKFLLDRIYNSSGVLNDVYVNDERCLATYTRNVDTGWMIVTIRPYHYILNKIYTKAEKAIVFGLCMIIFCSGLAYFLSVRLAKPIIEITEVVDKIAEGDESVQTIEVKGDDELGQMAAAFNKIRSQRDNFQLESELDKLTELFNKKTMENLCRMKLKTFNENETSNIFMAFYIIDLDHFKEVNDLLGHQFGDRVLVEFAKGLKKIFRPNDCIGRFGGDEFVVIVDSLPNMEVVIRKAEQIKQIALNLTIDGKGKFVTASIGIAIAPHSGRDYESLFEAADKAVYHVKNNGKNGYYCQLFADKDDNDDETAVYPRCEVNKSDRHSQSRAD